MNDTFWQDCTAALQHHLRGDQANSTRLLDRVESGLAAVALDPGLMSRRKQHLGLLKFHLAQGLNPASAPVAKDVAALQARVSQLERLNLDLVRQLQSMPTIDPLCVIDPTFQASQTELEDFGIILYGHTRLEELESVLESLKRQEALQFTEVWLDGHQGKPAVREKLQATAELVNRYPVKLLHTQNGNYGFRKMMLLGLAEMSRRYRDILVLEDDCFPTRSAISEFRQSLDAVRDDPKIFSVYGHHFLTASERETCNRFQGWGWATTSEKLRPVVRQLMDCYAMTEDQYLKFVQQALTPEMRARIDVTPMRQPTVTLERFFAWDETLCLLTAMNGQVHVPTKTRTIYNCGMGKDSTHFALNEQYRKPPFNLITPDEVWQYF